MTARPARVYRGRFAPSPTGLLHAGSMVAALASWLDARAHGGRWTVRIEDLDRARERPGAAEGILRQLDACGLRPDEPPLFQTLRGASHDAALARLIDTGWAYPCACSRADIAQALAAVGAASHRSHRERVYPGTCRDGLQGRAPRAWRVRVSSQRAPSGPLTIDWHDRRLGPQRQAVDRVVGDVVLRRADGPVAYQLAVVVDDAEAGITDVVRGEDLADNTPRQMHLQKLLGHPTPRYLHAPLVLGGDGEKLSKQNGAEAVDAVREPMAVLRSAGRALGLAVEAADLDGWRAEAVERWRDRWVDVGSSDTALAERLA